MQATMYRVLSVGQLRDFTDKNGKCRKSVNCKLETLDGDTILADVEDKADMLAAGQLIYTQLRMWVREYEGREYQSTWANQVCVLSEVII